MNGRRPQAGPDPEGAHLVLFDGLCGLCSRSIQFILRRDHRRVFKFAPLQSSTGRTIVVRAGGHPDALATLLVVERYQAGDPRVLSKSRAVLCVAREIGGSWHMAARLVGALVPVAWLDRLYDFIARHRFRIFGRLDHCRVPTALERNRFVETKEEKRA